MAAQYRGAVLMSSALGPPTSTQIELVGVDVEVSRVRIAQRDGALSHLSESR